MAAGSHQYFSISVSTGFSTWATLRNQWKHGNTETWQPMSCFSETLKMTNYGNLRNLWKPIETAYLRLKSFLTSPCYNYVHLEKKFWIKLDYKCPILKTIISMQDVVQQRDWEYENIAQQENKGWRSGLHWTRWNIDLRSVGRYHGLISAKILVCVLIIWNIKSQDVIPSSLAHIIKVSKENLQRFPVVIMRKQRRFNISTW